jgi:hypothetical protein
MLIGSRTQPSPPLDIEGRIASRKEKGFHPSAAFTDAAVAEGCGGLRPGVREPFFMKRTVPFIY